MLLHVTWYFFRINQFQMETASFILLMIIGVQVTNDQTSISPRRTSRAVLFTIVNKNDKPFFNIRGFRKVVEIDKNDNFGIRGFTTWKEKKNPATNCHHSTVNIESGTSAIWILMLSSPRICYFGRSVIFLIGYTPLVLTKCSKSKVLVVQEQNKI